AAATPDGARKRARAITANRARYEAVEQATGVPWFMIGPIHAREYDMDFATHLHNGDSLKARTYHVPAGRPKRGTPPFQWDASAIDALTMAPHELQKVKAWSVERILYETEKYNGWGYLKRGNSPYLWSWTSGYRGGRSARDGVYARSHWDGQAGLRRAHQGARRARARDRRAARPSRGGAARRGQRRRHQARARGARRRGRDWRRRRRQRDRQGGDGAAGAACGALAVARGLVARRPRRRGRAHRDRRHRAQARRHPREVGGGLERTGRNHVERTPNWNQREPRTRSDPPPCGEGRREAPGWGRAVIR